MKQTRMHLAILAAGACLSLLAACSKSDDKGAPDTTAPPAEAPGAPGAAPAAPGAAPGSAPTPEPGAGSQSTPAPSSGAADESASDKAKDLGNKIADKAGEIKDSAVDKAGEVGDAIKRGAASADHKIQDSVGNGQSTPPSSPGN
ncbi:hypothetical protein KVP10_00365 [Candidimonas humi]|uniref:Lipoprotein n=1 Tax=Candidimonas humi TaxID=683355 RepID=A0ABV8NVH8_9BURK|nr:hypothetical protein [Candidimonas humi]MBV6303314.1 hypothetical protein [Candidimonas humi]